MSDTFSLPAIGERLRTQDNLATALPIFIVQQKDEVVCNPDYSHAGESPREIFRDEDGDEVTDSDRLGWIRIEEERTGRVPDGYDRIHVVTVWEFVTACFTRVGAEEHIRQNGHNLNSPRIYVSSAFRNPEWEAVRNFLISQETTQ